MSFSIGSSSPGMGPRTVLENFGGNQREGEMFNRDVVKRMLLYLKPYRWRMGLALFLTILESGLTLLSPYLLKEATDSYILKGNFPGLVRIAIYLALTFISLYFVSAAQRYVVSWVGQRMLAKLRSDLFRHLQRLQQGYHDRNIVGVTVSRVINDVAEINELFSQGVITLIGDLLVLIGIIVVMLTMSPKLALLTFIVIPLMLFATWIFSRQAKKAFRETRSKVAAVVGDLAEDISGMRVIQAFAQEKASQERFDKVNVENRNAYINAMTLSFVFLPSIEFLGMVATGIVLWFGGRFVIAEEVTLGVMVAFLSYVTRFFTPIQELSRMYTTLQSAMAGGEQVLKLLDTPIEVADAPDAIELEEVVGQIEFNHVTFQYRQDTPIVLDDISLTIPARKMVAIVGPTGAGKTTIANLVARFYDVTQGAVLLDGIDLRCIQQSSLRQFVRIVSQDPFLFSRSIEENIRYGKPDASEDEVINAAKKANAHEFISHLPNGYRTKIQEGGVNISVGQRQLLTIARAILTDPKVLILDEATANIDTVTEVLIQQALERLLFERTAIVIAHRLSTVRKADWIYVIDQGKIREQGTHTDLLALNGMYNDLYERQFMGA
ncbi:MAG: ABC transporter ATP-binding protein [Anaerolineaceae bacterium]|jgi:ABC-type multidrug transport system fused ATPase/permease subunit|nr:ABC transporter ATP-binding protein [Anaerolineaceae bacterium]